MHKTDNKLSQCYIEYAKSYYLKNNRQTAKHLSSNASYMCVCVCVRVLLCRCMDYVMYLCIYIYIYISYSFEAGAN